MYKLERHATTEYDRVEQHAEGDTTNENQDVI